MPTTDLIQDKMLTFAHEIVMGKCGEDFVYSLEEDYVYLYEKGVWKPLRDKEFLYRIENSLPEVTRYSLPTRKQIVENFKHRKFVKIEEFNKWPLINFINTMYDPMGNNILAHDKKYYSTNRIPYKYDEFAQCPLWVRTLNEILENNQDKINLLQEFLGYCLTYEGEQKKGLLLLGDTDTGKSTIIDIVREVLGDKNISNVPLEHLANPQYTPLLMNKTVNLDPDVNKNAVNYEREFKIITGGKNEKVSCNQKHIPTFEFTPRCKIILAANIFPRITDHSSAFYQRLLIVSCERKFLEHEKNRRLHDQLREELPGIFNWFVCGLHRLIKRGRFEQFEFMTETLNELENENNPSNIFFDEYIEVDLDNDVYIEKSDLFDKYCKWCRLNEQHNLTHIQFSRVLLKRFFKSTPKDSRLNNNGNRIWRNLKYINSVLNNYKLREEIQWK